jgi:hypothetical protein
LSRSATTLPERKSRADTERALIIDGTRSNAALQRHPSTTLVRTKLTASAAPVQQLVGRDVSIIRRLTANSAILAKSLVCLSLFGLVSAIAFIYKYLILALTYVMAYFYSAEFDRDTVIEALREIEKDSCLAD